MSLFRLKDLEGSTLMEKVVNAINLSREIQNNIKPKNTVLLTRDQMKFVQKVSQGLTHHEVSALKNTILRDPSIIYKYKERSMLKDVSTGKLKPKSQFAIDLNYPARGFRAISSTP